MNNKSFFKKFYKLQFPSDEFFYVYLTETEILVKNVLQNTFLS